MCFEYLGLYVWVDVDDASFDLEVTYLTIEFVTKPRRGVEQSMGIRGFHIMHVQGLSLQ